MCNSFCDHLIAPLQTVFISILVDWRLKIAFFTCVTLMYLGATYLPSVLANSVSNKVQFAFHFLSFICFLN